MGYNIDIFSNNGNLTLKSFYLPENSPIKTQIRSLDLTWYLRYPQIPRWYIYLTLDSYLLLSWFLGTVHPFLHIGL